jgi:antitoxin (DNA-binding transcriptional repressor) of toxin-antitoxin stability system
VATEITQRQLRNDSGDIMRRLDAGETFVVTRNGVPVGELFPSRRTHFVPAEVVKRAFQGAPRIDYVKMRQELDAVADPTAEPRV